MDEELQLRRRFERFSGPTDTDDWYEVLQFAERLRTQKVGRRATILSRRRRVILGAAFGIFLILTVAPALAIRADIFSFSSGEKAPAPVQSDFDSLDVGAPPGMAPGVAAQPRRVISIAGADGEHSLWLAPTRAGGFCVQVDQLAGGCDRDRQVPLAVEMARKTMASPILIWGSVLDDAVRSVVLEHEDGDTTAMALTRVTAPIGASFFLIELPEARERRGSRPVAVVARDDDGEVLIREAIPHGVVFTGHVPGK
jgi:hypothetical protein